MKLEVGQVKVWHKLITVEIGTEARLRQLQQGLPSPVLIGRAQAPSLPVGRKATFGRTSPNSLFPGISPV